MITLFFFYPHLTSNPSGRLREERSKWCGYIKSLPLKTVNLPMFWELDVSGSLDGSEALSWLRGTEAAKILSTASENGISILV